MESGVIVVSFGESGRIGYNDSSLFFAKALYNFLCPSDSSPTVVQIDSLFMAKF